MNYRLPSIITIIILFLVSVLLFLIAQRLPNSHNNVDCWPVSTSQSTGTIRCWSGGELVYQNSIYHNGGVLCAIDGHEIKITGGKSLCVIESDQEDVWAPPNEQLTPVP